MRAYREKNRDLLKLKDRLRYANNPELFRRRKRESILRHLEETRKRCREWHRTHSEHRRKYREKYRERYRADWRRYYRNTKNKDKINARRLRSKARRRSIEKRVLAELFTREEIFDRCKGVCFYCHKKIRRNKWHLDHKIPLSKGGTHTRGNVTASCPKCNLSKADKII